MPDAVVPGTVTETPAALPPIAAPVSVAKPAPVVPAPAAAAPVVPGAPAAGAPAEPKRARLDATGDDLPEDAEILEMSRSAFNSRLTRATSKELKKRFGTDDIEEINKDREELKTLREEKEAKRLEAMTELDREKEARAVAERERDEARTQAKEAHEHRVYERDDRHMVRLAEKTIDPDRVDKVLAAFAVYVSEKYDRRQLRKMNARDLDADAAVFFEEHIKKHPKHAKDYEEKLRVTIAAELKADARAKLGKKAGVVTNGGPGNSRPTATEEGGDDKPLGKQSYAKIKEAGFSYR